MAGERQVQGRGGGVDGRARSETAGRAVLAQQDHVVIAGGGISGVGHDLSSKTVSLSM